MATLTQLVRTLTRVDDSPYSVYERAIALFEFQVETVYPGRRLGAKGMPRSHVKMRSAAATLATVKLLEKAEADLGQRLGREPNLTDLADDQLYRDLYERQLRPRGGLKAVRHTLAAKAFDRRIRERWMAACAAAEIIDVSYRFDPAVVTSRHKGGLNTAYDYLANAPEYKGKYTIATLKRRWSAFGASAGFIYLIRKHRFEFRPRRVATKNFADLLLEDARDRTTLAHFFSGYLYVRNVLKARKYNLPSFR